MMVCLHSHRNDVLCSKKVCSSSSTFHGLWDPLSPGFLAICFVLFCFVSRAELLLGYPHRADDVMEEEKEPRGDVRSFGAS